MDHFLIAGLEVPVALRRRTLEERERAWCSPSHRRRGLATRVVEALGDWARARGASHAYLQVAAPNTVAIASYERLGFADHHTYVHMAAPA